MTALTTHVLDAASGRPAAGMAVAVRTAGAVVATAETDADGRAALGRLGAGEHTLVFDTGAWFAARGVEAFYPSVAVAFRVDGEPHAHVPLLLSPFAYSTYRGS